MPSSGLHGSFSLTREKIGDVVLGVGAGAYALGYSANNRFTIQYVGRSDTDLARRLGEHADEGAYPRFKYGFLGSAREAFYKESFLFHEFGETRLLHNDCHPRRPDGTAWECPFCDIFS
jgi:hypothetical protein